MPVIHRSTPHRPVSPPVYRWECTCREPPVVLATYDLSGQISFKDFERYWQLNGRVATNCPKCGKPHMLDVQIDPQLLATLPHPWRGGD